ncbi:hypothetical protein MNBD_UNCLBAC01-330 [hydrothermal vent metagenome]|uniref:P pilus assembly protein, chaperone PapD n=1 Tax=hydrothermal vent metagenome TaxID=652676 RepID=A0A3B1D113_9ZZZZ
MKKIIFIIFFLSGCLGLLLIKPSFAQMFLEQGKVSLVITPGENITGELVVHNTTDQEIQLNAYWEDFIYKAPFDGTKEFIPAGTSDYSLASWVHFSPQDFTISPYGKKKISYIFNVPQNISGGYYGVLFLEKEATPLKGKRGVNVVTRVGGLFFLESVNQKKEAVLENITISSQSLQADFINTGDVILIPQGIFYVLSEDGRVVDRGEIETIYIPPGQKASYQMVFNNDFSIGKYTLVATIDLQQDNVLVKEIDFEKKDVSINILTIRD